MKNYLIITVILFNYNLFSQEEPVEEYYQNCLYSSLSNHGNALKKYAKGFENHLIELKILKDTTSQSYYNLFKSFSKEKAYPESYKYSFIDSINNKFERNKIVPFNNVCYDKMAKLKTFRGSKLFKIQSLMDIDNSNVKFSKQMETVISILEEKDFELDFYKQRTFIFLYFTHLFSGKDALSFAKE